MERFSVFVASFRISFVCILGGDLLKQTANPSEILERIFSPVLFFGGGESWNLLYLHVPYICFKHKMANADKYT